MKLENLSFSYGEKQIFRALELELPERGVTALVGPSGCGKTTALRLLAGLERPQSGRVLAPPPEQIALLFQEDRLIPGLAAARQITLACPAEPEPERWLRAVGLEREAQTPPEALSGGMQRRLSLARCLAYAEGKALLLLDEPFTGVDPDRIQSLIACIRGMDIPTVFTAHDAESLRMADRSVPLEQCISY